MTFDHHLLDANDAVFPDNALFDAMKDGGGFYWHERGSVERGTRFMDIVKHGINHC